MIRLLMKSSNFIPKRVIQNSRMEERSAAVVYLSLDLMILLNVAGEYALSCMD